MQLLKQSPALGPPGSWLRAGAGGVGGERYASLRSPRNRVLDPECCVTLGKSGDLSEPLGDTLPLGEQN